PIPLLACPGGIFGGILRIGRVRDMSMRWHGERLRSYLLALALAIGSSLAMAADVTVFAAASLKEALDEQAKQFEAGSGNKVVISYAASNALARQIEAGAPADIFISADLDWMDYVG